MNKVVTLEQVFLKHFGVDTALLPRTEDNRIMVALTDGEYAAVRKALSGRQDGSVNNLRALLGVMCGWFEDLAGKAGWTRETAPAAWAGYSAARKAMNAPLPSAENDGQHPMNEDLLGILREVTAVAITMLYDSHKDDTLAEFSADELRAVVDCTKHLQEVPVESIYRRGFDASVTLLPTSEDDDNED